MVRKLRFLLIMSCLAIFVQANAQFDDPKTLEVGPHVGLSYYMGDLNPTKPFAMSDLEYGGVVRFNYNNRWSFRFDYTHATVKADDAVVKWRPERGLSFTTNLNDFSFVAEFNFLEYYTGNPKRNVSPYIFGGISLFQYTPYTYINDTVELNLFKYYTEDTKLLSDSASFFDKLIGREKAPFKIKGKDGDILIGTGVSIPFGVGVKFALSKHMAATVEWRMQKTFTDYLDDVATVYPAIEGHAYVVIDELYYDLTDPTMTPTGLQTDDSGNPNPPSNDEDYHYKENQQRGNSAFNDWFGMARVSLTWKFNLPDGRGCNLSKF